MWLTVNGWTKLIGIGAHVYGIFTSALDAMLNVKIKE